MWTIQYQIHPKPQTIGTFREHHQLGKPHVRIFNVQPEFCRKGGGGWIALPNGLWHFFSEYEPLLRNQICIVFHHYLLWFPSKCHLRIMFDHSYCQNIHSQSQNRRFKEFAHFRRKIPATKRRFAWGAGGWNAIRQYAVWTCSILTWVFPYVAASACGGSPYFLSGFFYDNCLYLGLHSRKEFCDCRCL